MVNQTLVLRINPDRYRDGKIATCAKLQNVMPDCKKTAIHTSGTFGFARHTSQRFAKPKEPFLLPIAIGTPNRILTLKRIK